MENIPPLETSDTYKSAFRRLGGRSPGGIIETKTFNGIDEEKAFRVRDDIAPQDQSSVIFSALTPKSEFQVKHTTPSSSSNSESIVEAYEEFCYLAVLLGGCIWGVATSVLGAFTCDSSSDDFSHVD